MPVITIGIHDAKTTLSRLVKQAAQGQEIVITSNGKPVARLVPYSPPPLVRKPGSLAGKIVIKPDFDEIPEGFDVFANEP